MAAPDPKKFNEDPKHEKDREAFDAMIESSLNRITEKKKKDASPPPAEKGFLDELLEGMGFGSEK